eukprot:GHVU01234219.1.p1 GENE.GHVU01234219.1~~GHVU01234219.1.p1  ORF type:complete len:128 (+),score=9.52 GHVU01234219.1:150-533(+)
MRQPPEKKKNICVIFRPLPFHLTQFVGENNGKESKDEEKEELREGCVWSIRRHGGKVYSFRDWDYSLFIFGQMTRGHMRFIPDSFWTQHRAPSLPLFTSELPNPLTRSLTLQLTRLHRIELCDFLNK